MFSTLLTNELVAEVRAAAKAYGRIIDLAFDILLQGKEIKEADEAEFIELKRIQRNLLGDLGVITKLVFSGVSGRPEDLKEARSEVGLLVMRCDVTVQLPPITNIHSDRRNPPVKREEKCPVEALQDRGELSETQRREIREKDEKIRRLNESLNKRAGSGSAGTI